VTGIILTHQLPRESYRLRVCQVGQKLCQAVRDLWRALISSTMILKTSKHPAYGFVAAEKLSQFEREILVCVAMIHPWRIYITNFEQQAGVRLRSISWNNSYNILAFDDTLKTDRPLKVWNTCVLLRTTVQSFSKSRTVPWLCFDTKIQEQLSNTK
jgi:hypothetical protein